MTAPAGHDAPLPWWRQEVVPPAPHVAVLPVVLAATAAALLVATGRVTAAVVLLVAVTLFTHARAVAPAVTDRLERRLDVAAGWLARGLSRFLLGVVYGVVFLPAAAISGARRRLPRRSRGERSWTHRPPPDALPRVARAYGFEPTGRRPSAGIAVRSAAGLAAFVLLDVSIGAGLTGSGLLLPLDRAEVKQAIEDQFASQFTGPVFADEPWSDELARDLADFELAPRTYQPFVVRTFEPFTSPYVNTTAAERVSYVPDTGGEDPIVVAFFGGSVMFGVGQRDDHTIPSEVARLAEAEGIPVEVHNYGLPGLTLFQEFLQLERLLAAGHRFDAVVFLDGFNEFYVQGENPSADPTHLGVGVLRGLSDEFYREQSQDPGFTSALGELVDAYHRSSATWRLLDRLRGAEPPPVLRVDAAPVDEATMQADVLAIYQRSQDLVRSLTEDTTIGVSFFWQPKPEGWAPSVLDELPAGTIDVSGAFGDSNFYFDEVHTNEAGARVLAAALWEQLRPTLER